MNTNELIQAFKTWDGNAFIKAHLAWLKGSYHLAQQPQSVVKAEEGEATRVKREKQIPYVNKEKAARNHAKKYFSPRQLRKVMRDYAG